MSQEEEHSSKQDLTYTAWHRSASLVRFMDADMEKFSDMIDIDRLEFDSRTDLEGGLNAS